MKKSIIPLYITVSEIKMRIRLSVDHLETEYPFEEKEMDEKVDSLGYEITGTGELSRIIELLVQPEDAISNVINKRFHQVKVCLRPAMFPEKNYSGKFFYISTNQQIDVNSKIDNFALSIFLNVPERSFHNFCNEIASKKIVNLVVSIELEAAQGNDVGTFGPPNKDDELSIEGSIGYFDSKIRLNEIEANIDIQDKERRRKNLP